MILSVKNLSFSYSSLRVLQGICLDAAAGEVLSLLGPNGSGKSTLLKCINGILSPDSGEIRLGAMDLRRMSHSDIARCIAYVPQILDQGPVLSVFEFVLMGRRPHAHWSVSRKDKVKTQDTIAMLGLEAIAFRDMNELSGGQRQSVQIARALAQEAKVVLMDEPTAHLDIAHQLGVCEWLVELARNHGLVVIAAMHDLNLALRISDQIVMLHEGKVEVAGSPKVALTPSNIARVYNVSASLIEISGFSVVVPLERNQLPSGFGDP